MRTVPTLIATAGILALALTGCTSAQPEPEATSGPASDLIRVSGDFGEKPDVVLPTPIKTERTECTEIIPGAGEHLVEGQKALVDLSIFNGETGDLIDASSYDGTDPIAVTLSEATLPGLRSGLTCAQKGSRIALVVSPEDAFGPTGNPQIGIGPDTSIVFVIDVQRTYPTRAEGELRPGKSGFPAVVEAPDGRPGISVPPTEAPTDFGIEVLRAGNGDTVTKDDSVTVHYTGVLWTTEEVFDSTWEKGAPISLSLDQVVPGFAQAIEGQKVGSQVVAIIPPDEGYGAEGSGAIPGDATLIFVIDILGID